MENNMRFHIKPPDKLLTTDFGGGQATDISGSESDEQATQSLKINAAPLFDKKWNDAQAAQLRNNLANLLPGNETFAGGARDSILMRQTEQANNLLKQSWNDLINLAAQHRDLESFHQETAEFWESVVVMSVLRTVETYVNGQLEPRVVSRYGELLGILNNQGGAARLEDFLLSLPAGERDVFLARYQISQTFGAGYLFAGRSGVAPDQNGRFPLKVFLFANGKNLQMPVNPMLGIYAGENFATSEQKSFAADFRFLLNPASASLLGLSLAFYQNVNAFISINELTAETFLQKAGDESAAAHHELSKSKNNLEKAATNRQLTAENNERTVGAALIGGALKTIEEYRQKKYSAVGFEGGFENSRFEFGFAAGATGAIMSATIGCIAPLAEKTIGEVVGFAASVVLGLTDTGLRSLGANALVLLVTSGVQIFLDASSAPRKTLTGKKTASQNFPDAAQILETNLNNNTFNHPALILR